MPSDGVFYVSFISCWAQLSSRDLARLAVEILEGGLFLFIVGFCPTRWQPDIANTINVFISQDPSYVQTQLLADLQYIFKCYQS